MSKINLSICIPTYNFGNFIGETLEKITRQLCEGIEIVIVDGGSTDHTEEIVHEFTKKIPSIRYCHLEKRGGIDKDLAHAISLANGEYCWLFSSDDLIVEGALQKVLNQIQSGYDLYLCGFSLCSFDKKYLLGVHKMSNLTHEQVFDFQDKDQRLFFFENAVTTSAFFSFMSSLIIKKSRWEATACNIEFYGSCWAHVARIFNMKDRGLRVKYFPEVCLHKRCDNDSFLDKGLIHRVGIAIYGYNKIADHFFGKKSVEAFHIRRVLKNEQSLGYMYLLKHLAKNKVERKEVEKLTRLLYIDAGSVDKAKLAAFYCTPYPVYILLRTAFRLMKGLKKRVLNIKAFAKIPLNSQKLLRDLKSR